MNSYCSYTQKQKFISIFESKIGLKIIDQQTSNTQVFQFQNKSIKMDWNNFLEEKQIENNQILSFYIENDDQKLQIFGDQEHLTSIYNFCTGKFIFQRGTNIQTLKQIMEIDDFKLNLIYDQHLKKEYEEKIIILREQQNLEESQYSQFTNFLDKSIPEEILVIQDLQTVYIPQIIQVQALYFDGVSYSYVYSKKDLINITQYYDNSQNNNKSFIVHVAQQLLLLLIAFEDKEIIHPGIQLKNIYTNPYTQDIILTSYCQAHYSNQNINRHILNIGYTAPEYFKKNTKITPKSNIYQVGIVLFHLLFGHSPFGKTKHEIIQNQLTHKQNLNLLNTLDPLLSDFIRKLLEKDPQKRLDPQQLLKHKIFSLTVRESYSKQSVEMILPNQDIEEFISFDKNSNIQSVKKIQLFQKK